MEPTDDPEESATPADYKPTKEDFFRVTIAANLSGTGRTIISEDPKMIEGLTTGKTPKDVWIEKEDVTEFKEDGHGKVSFVISGRRLAYRGIPLNRFPVARIGEAPAEDEDQNQETITAEPMVNMPTATNSPTTNLILYGPPGTGKTYETVWEAVRLCMGDDAAAPLRDDRVALMEEYRRLVDEGRIEFVTFHQSFSYEEFVEGLRPTTGAGSVDDEQGETVPSGGFSLKPRDGVFKVISERARLDAGEVVTERLDTGEAVLERLDRTRPIYKMALGRRGTQQDAIREALDQSWIHIGWADDFDLSDDRFDDAVGIEKGWKEWKKNNPGASDDAPNFGMLDQFRSRLQIGDYVVINDGIDRFRAFGKVTGEYEFHEDAEFFRHRRSVEWIWCDDNGTERTFYPNRFAIRSISKLERELIDWDALETVVIGPDAERPIEGARPHVLVIDEINRANISRVFGELITLLEADKRLGCENELRVRLPYSGTRFGVPPNLHIVGTMNTADRSIALLDTALRRRFAFRELMPDALVLYPVDGIDLGKLLTKINERIEYLFDREHQIGHAYFIGCQSRDDVERVMRDKVIPLLAEYFYEDWSKVAAVLGDSAGSPDPCFLEAEELRPPAGLSGDSGDDDPYDRKWRWQVMEEFDFWEFETDAKQNIEAAASEATRPDKSGAFAKKLIRAKKTDEEVLEAVKVEFPNGKTTIKTIRSYRRDLIAEGEDIPGNRELKKKLAEQESDT